MERDGNSGNIWQRRKELWEHFRRIMVPSAIRRRHDKAGKGVKERETIQETEMISPLSIIIIRAFSSTC